MARNKEGKFKKFLSRIKGKISGFLSTTPHTTDQTTKKQKRPTVVPTLPKETRTHTPVSSAKNTHPLSTNQKSQLPQSKTLKIPQVKPPKVKTVKEPRPKPERKPRPPYTKPPREKRNHDVDKVIRDILKTEPPKQSDTVEEVPVETTEEYDDWDMTPEEIKFASMTTYETVEYEKRYGKISVAPNMNFFAETVIGNFRRELQHFPSKAEPKLNRWLDSVISRYGTEDVANMLQYGRENGLVVTPDIAYDDILLEGYISDMLDYLPDMTDWYKAEIMDSMEEWYDVE